MKILIAGLGLIGGSFAKAIKTKTDDYLYAMDLSDEVIKQAVSQGAVDKIVTEIPADTDIILIALYPKTAVEFVRLHKDSIPDGSMLIDLCGVKRYVCDAISGILGNRDVVYIGGHPMAGRELSGFSASVPDLFVGASMILTPENTVTKNHRLLAELFFKRLGFTKITYTTPERHDELIALTSQLAHIVSSAYVQNPAASEHMGFSAGSFQDMTRVAKLHEQMWTELFLLNPDYLILQINQFIDKLAQFRDAIAEKDEKALCGLLRTGRMIKEQLLEQNR